VVNSDIEAERDHLRVGDHTVRVLTMKEAICETRPLVLDQLFKISANFYVVTEWTPVSMAKARKEVNARAGTSILRSPASSPRCGTTRFLSGSAHRRMKQADIEDLGRLLASARQRPIAGGLFAFYRPLRPGRAALDRQIGEVYRCFHQRRRALFTETYNQLNAFFAAVPALPRQNLRKLPLLNCNYARLVFPLHHPSWRAMESAPRRRSI